MPSGDFVHGAQRSDTDAGSIRRPQAEVVVRIVVDLHAVSCRGTSARAVNRAAPVTAVKQDMAARKRRSPDCPAADSAFLEVQRKTLDIGRIDDVRPNA